MNPPEPNRYTRRSIGRDEFDAVIFDLDGIVTDTAHVHAAAWTEMFNEYLQMRAERSGEPYVPFDTEQDYREYVDGKPRYEGVRSFMESREIILDYGDPEDAPGTETYCGLGNRKNESYQVQLKKMGAAVFESTVVFIRALLKMGFKTAIVSSSKNCLRILKMARLTDLFQTRVDGVVSAEIGLKGKPNPDIFVEAARRLKVAPARAIVVEDAISGVQAGQAGNFGLTLGVDRTGDPCSLLDNGADIVVPDLEYITVATGPIPAQTVRDLPNALECKDGISGALEGKRLAVFLDYDGTLTPIVARPELAVLSDDMRAIVTELSHHCTLAIVSGRDRSDVEGLVKIDSLIFAGSHGFDIRGPAGLEIQSEIGAEHRPVLDQVRRELEERLGRVEGALLEPKKFSLAVHYRLVAAEDMDYFDRCVDEVLGRHPELKKKHGKKVYELQPRLDWDKGKAVLWLLEALKLDTPDVLPMYLGDDITDEDAFKALVGIGIGIMAGDATHATAGLYSLADTEEVGLFLQFLTTVTRS